VSSGVTVALRAGWGRIADASLALGR
jgi:hypothetical protein